MPFSDLYKSPKTTFARLRSRQPPLPTEWDVELFSRDREKLKLAIKRHLESRVRCDWEFTCARLHSSRVDASPLPIVPAEEVEAADGSYDVQSKPAQHDQQLVALISTSEVKSSVSAKPDEQSLEKIASAATADTSVVVPSCDQGYNADTGTEVESDYSTISEDETRYRFRTDWDSDSESVEEGTLKRPGAKRSPVSATVIQSLEKKAQKRREHRRDMKWNTGLACFEERRDAWTGARAVRLKPSSRHTQTARRENKPENPLSPRRLFSKKAVTTDIVPTVPTLGKDDAPIMVAQRQLPVVTILPNPTPILPKENLMRASITPLSYPNIYERVVMQNMTPSCPINLSDMIKSCVTGWKLNGEWPPRPNAPEPMFTRRKKTTSQPVDIPVTHTSIPLSAGNAISSTKKSNKLAVTGNVRSSAPVLDVRGSIKHDGRRLSLGSFLLRDKSKEKSGDEQLQISKHSKKSWHKVFGWHPHQHGHSHHDDQGLQSATAPMPATTCDEQHVARGSLAPAVVTADIARGNLSPQRSPKSHSPH